MNANNKSRVDFNIFCKEHNFKRDGKRNVFFMGNQKVIYAQGNTNSVRQFYEDCDAAYLNNSIHSKSEFDIQGITRITAKGLKAFNACLKTK